LLFPFQLATLAYPSEHPETAFGSVKFVSKRHLTDLSIAKLPHAPTYCVWDATFPSFGLRVGKRRKTFVLKQHNKYHIVGHYPITSLKVSSGTQHGPPIGVQS